MVIILFNVYQESFLFPLVLNIQEFVVQEDSELHYCATLLACRLAVTQETVIISGGIAVAEQCKQN